MEKENDPEVSILVPVYNVGSYLRQSLESISKQTFRDWECVMVDDGSTDGSGDICDEFARRDPRFRVIHVKNGGIAAARNILVKASRGKYIAFCDPDDWVEPEFIATLHSLITGHDADISQVDFWKEFKGSRGLKSSVDSVTVFDREQAMIALLRDKKVRSFLWNKMFRRHIVAPEFPPGKLFEDLFVCTRWFSRINRMVAAPTPLYHYRMREGSLLHTKSISYRLDYLYTCRCRAKEMLYLNTDRFTQKDYDAYMVKSCVNAAKLIARQGKNREEIDRALDFISQSMESLTSLSAQDLGPKLWLRGNLLKKHPRLFSRLMQVLGRLDLHTRYRNSNLFK